MYYFKLEYSYMRMSPDVSFVLVFLKSFVALSR